METRLSSKSEWLKGIKAVYDLVLLLKTQKTFIHFAFPKPILVSLSIPSLPILLTATCQVKFLGTGKRESLPYIRKGVRRETTGQ